jgi:hypothetical protein
MSNLTTAQKMWEAFAVAASGHEYEPKKGLAAALRAAIHATAKQRVIQGWPVSEPGFCPVDELLAIAAELEAS